MLTKAMPTQGLTALITSMIMIGACSSNNPATPLKADAENQNQPMPDLPISAADGNQVSPPPSGWAKSFGGTGNDKLAQLIWQKDMLYMAGRYEATVAFGGTNFTAKGEMDAFAAKLDKNGNVQWATTGGGKAMDWVEDIAVDSKDNVYIVGRFEETATFGSKSLTAKEGSTDGFLVKLDASGVVQWAKNIGGIGIDFAYALTIDSSDNVLFAGTFQQKADIGKTSLSAQGKTDCYLAKVDPDGTFLWVTHVPGNSASAHCNARSLVLDNAANIILTGYFIDSLLIGNTLLTSVTKDSGDAFIAKFDAAGKPVWAISGGDKGYDFADGVAVDSNNNIFVTGRFVGNISLGGKSIIGKGDEDAYVIKLDSSGKAVWAANFSGERIEASGSRVTLDSTGNIFATGYFSGVEGKIAIGSKSFSAKGKNDFYLVKLDANGNVLWANTAGGDDDDVDYGLTVANSNEVYVAGDFKSKAAFDTTNLTSHGGYDIVVWQVTLP